MSYGKLAILILSVNIFSLCVLCDPCVSARNSIFSEES